MVKAIFRTTKRYTFARHIGESICSFRPRTISVIRQHLVLSDIAEQIDPDREWLKLNTIGMVKSFRSVNGKTTLETRYYISSLENNAEIIANAVRSPWDIENCLHWVLDVGFREDDSRIRKDNAPENFGILRLIALNLLNQEKTLKRGVKTKQLRAGWDDKYLAKVLAGITTD
jgi:predicted transposase YbfD/YdcC